MAEKIDFGEPRETAVVRSPILKFEVIRWDWDNNKRKDTQPIDITPLVVSCQWMKTIKSPESGCQIMAIPQIGDIHLLDYIDTMDVVQIKEFGVLKFQGYVRRIQASGEIMQDGKPSRLANIVVQTMSSLFVSASLGLNCFANVASMDVRTKMENFASKFASAVKNKSVFSDIIKLVVNEWYDYVSEMGSPNFVQYLSSFLDFETGASGKTAQGLARELFAFNPSSEEIMLWQGLQKIAELPFNEMWFDVGPRSVYLERNSSLSKYDAVNLSEEKTYMIFRQTPFNGTVLNGIELNLFDNLPSRKIPINYLVKFDLGKTMDESYSFYLVTPPMSNVSSIELTATGFSEIDEEAFKKYLFRQLTKDQFYYKLATDVSKTPSAAQSINKYQKDYTKTLRNWNTGNDKFLSGSFTINVPNNPDHDPKIGDKIEFDSLSDAYFYVEGISHTWRYGGPLQSTLSVTRGWGLGKPIELKDKIYKRGKFAMNEQFNEP